MSAARSRRRARWFGLGVVFVGAVGFALHCGDAADSTFDECRSMYEQGCGQSCGTDDECGLGLHCAAGRCNAECGPGKACTDGRSCTSSGRCGGGGFGEGGSPQSDGSTSDSGGCGDLSVSLGKRTPTIVVLVDRSGSMEESFGSGTRWTTLKNVLLDGGVIQSLQNEVSFGLTMYSNGQPAVRCPELVTVAPALDNFTPIRNSLSPANTRPDTPTGESILAVAGITDAGITDGGLAALDTGGGEKVILLVTDGDPDYCGNRLANDPPLDPVEVQTAMSISIDAVQRAYDAGIKTYVLAIGSEVSVPHQQQMANAGLGFDPDAGDAAPFFRPTDEAQLTAQIGAIITGARPCKFPLNGSVQPGFESRGTVTLNGSPLVFDDPNGWRLTSPSEIELLGTACETVKTAPTADLSATFPCGGVVVK